MLVEGSNILLAAIALVVIFLAARMVRRKQSGLFRSSKRADRAFTLHRKSGGMFAKQHTQALKKCPNCAKELSLSTLICEGCEYNFLAGTVGLRNRALPAPEPHTHESPEPSFPMAKRLADETA